MGLSIHDLGFRRAESGLVHQAALTETEAWCLDSLRTWCQRGRAIPARVLSDWLGIGGREARRLVNHLIDRQYHGLPVSSLPGINGGYLVPNHDALRDLASAAVAAQLRRASTGALKARDMGATVQELAQGVVALTLDLGEDVRQQVAGRLAAPRGSASHAQVRQTLARYARDPRQFAHQIDDLRRQFGGLFVCREELARVMRQQNEQFIEQTLARLVAAS